MAATHRAGPYCLPSEAQQLQGVHCDRRFGKTFDPGRDEIDRALRAIDSTIRNAPSSAGFEIVAHIGRLPVPVTAVWEWQLQAACRTVSSATFFHPWGERGAARDERVRRAKEVCAECPVIAACRRHALQVQEQYGVWGGLSEEERLVMLNRGRSSLRRKLLAQPTGSDPAHPRELDQATSNRT